MDETMAAVTARHIADASADEAIEAAVETGNAAIKEYNERPGR